jgi:hypothetical protein
MRFLMTTTVRRALAVLAALALALTGGLVAAAPAPADSHLTPLLTGIRTGLHPGFDRVVLDMSGPPPTATQWQHSDELIEDPTGEIVWLTGADFVAVVVHGAAAHDNLGNPTYLGPEKFRTRNLTNVMAVALTGDFEATLGVGVGTKHRSWVRVFTLSAPTRVVIDVGH